MYFSDILNNYIDIIGCTAKELSKASNISPAVLSRYRNGTRIPKYNSDQLIQLINGLDILTKKYNTKELNKDIIKKEFERILNKDTINFELFRTNYNILINTLNVNVSEMSRYIGFDASYLSKIKTGSRKPQNLNDFSNAVNKYIVTNYNDQISLELLSRLIKTDINNLKNKDLYFNILKKWLNNNTNIEDNNINNFLTKLDNFDLNDYINTIKFNKIKIPTLPAQLPNSKTYYGLNGFKTSQLDILKRIILSKSKEDIFFYSNMPMIEASKDKEFSKKFTIGLALILKKGLKLNMIHNLERPFNELMLGLEGWIPLYMTGLINSYYLKDNSNTIYSHIECTSGTNALSGICPTGHINRSKILVTNKKNEVKYYQENNKLLLKKADKLINIYNIGKEKEYLQIINNNSNIKGNRINILTSLPLYTIDNTLLKDILSFNKINIEEQQFIIDAINNEKNRINIILKHSKITDKITLLSETDFQKQTQYIDLSKICFNKKIIYNYDLYKRHLLLTQKYTNNNYNYQINKNNIFKNINIYIIKDKQVIITKTNNPTIHFIIYYPKLIDAITNFIKTN